jgi:Sigma-70, region 4
MSLRRLRLAIQNEQISFPAQVPVFTCQSRSDIQWRLVALYFVQNWSCLDLGQRYGVTMERVRQLLSQWVRRAAALGYLQEIPQAGDLVPVEGTEQEWVVPAAILGYELEEESLVLAASQ